MEQERETHGDVPTSGLDATRGINLGNLLSGLLGGQEDAETPPGASGSLSGLLTALAGGGDTVDLTAAAPETGLSHSALQALVPLIAGTLVGQSTEATGDAAETRAALADLAQGKAGAADALAGTGLLQEIMKRTGLDKSGALRVIVAVLKALGLGKAPSTGHAKPKPKPKPHAKPKPKPKPGASASSAKPKPRPKPSAHAASSKPKPKPKPAGHTGTSSTKPKRSGEVDETGA